jgi:hypothetical protein
MKFCEKCGKEIMDEAVICPGCGCAIGKSSVVEQKCAQGNAIVPKSAKTASIFGVLSLLLLAPFGIPAIILAQKSKKETGGVMCKQAKTGLVCGIIGLCFWGLSLLLMLSGM